eukprot:TRINITY_DN6605_c0_g3_i1.p2 TRINITY_DN6605_c0_g3~~TRINITY_DN6605_c0_g3_i1.p2  ORF type:complete len:781 (+),score=214.98 TRINITY_DN6605_c0_g3_i1:123-2345(+)
MANQQRLLCGAGLVLLVVLLFSHGLSAALGGGGGADADPAPAAGRSAQLAPGRVARRGDGAAAAAAGQSAGIAAIAAIAAAAGGGAAAAAAPSTGGGLALLRRARAELGGAAGALGGLRSKDHARELDLLIGEATRLRDALTAPVAAAPADPPEAADSHAAPLAADAPQAGAEEGERETEAIGRNASLDPHAIPHEYHTAYPRPPGWASPGCGIGPPPFRPEVPAACSELVTKYTALCSAAGRARGGANSTAAPAPHRGWALSHCADDGPWTVGRPASVVATAYGEGGVPSCGPEPGLHDVLDARVDGPRSVETISTSSPHPWMQLVSFRPVEAGEYTLFVRVHLRNWEGGWNFKKGPSNKRMKRLVQMGSEHCPLIRCNNPKGRWSCMVFGSAKLQVREGGCPQRPRPPCREVWPKVPGAWYGRWVRQCTDRASCERHAVATRPLDGARWRIDNTKLLFSAGACGPTEPNQPEARKAKSRVFHDPGGWAWEPHVCTPRVFNVSQAWRCMDNTGILSAGDSVMMTNGHLLWVWMDMNVPKGRVEVSERGKRHDEGYGVVQRHPRMTGGGENARMFYWQFARLRYSHLRDLTKGGSGMLLREQNEMARRVRAMVMSMGMHEAVEGHHLDPGVLRQWLRDGLSGMHTPLVWSPNPSPFVRLACSKKNPERLRLAVGAMDRALTDLIAEPGNKLPPIAFMPSFEMGRALWWDIPVADNSGTHGYCSLMGLSMWQQAWDLTCPP